MLGEKQIREEAEDGGLVAHESDGEGNRWCQIAPSRADRHSWPRCTNVSRLAGMREFG